MLDVRVIQMMMMVKMTIRQFIALKFNSFHCVVCVFMVYSIALCLMFCLTNTAIFIFLFNIAINLHRMIWNVISTMYTLSGNAKL